MSARTSCRSPRSRSGSGVPRPGRAAGCRPAAGTAVASPTSTSTSRAPYASGRCSSAKAGGPQRQDRVEQVPGAGAGAGTGHGNTCSAVTTDAQRSAAYSRAIRWYAGGEVGDGVGDQEGLDVVGERVDRRHQHPDVRVHAADDQLVAPAAAHALQQVGAEEGAVAPLGEHPVAGRGRQLVDHRPVGRGPAHARTPEVLEQAPLLGRPCRRAAPCRPPGRRGRRSVRAAARRCRPARPRTDAGKGWRK